MRWITLRPRAVAQLPAKLYWRTVSDIQTPPSPCSVRGGARSTKSEGAQRSFFGGIMATATLPYFYETEVEWTDQRRGDLESPGLASLEVASPPEFQGHEGVWTPEHYFVAAVNSCFMTTFLAIAEMSKLEFLSFDCKAVGKLEKVEGIGFQ